ncbi:MAG: hypothetical protein LM582_07040 [Desulfurococcaceae archaeon]|jgi:hemerythrin-like domain-containing protein|nr:hypothetical protein [Desulfurococcaceae archaeon]
MLYEHDLGGSYIKEMRRSLEVFNKHIEAKDKFKNTLSYISLLRDHIYKEDNILFKMALMVLTRNDDEELLRKFKEIENRE